MPKKTRLHKLRNQMRIEESSQTVQTGVVRPEFLSGDSVFKKDIIKSILFATVIIVVEIALYFIYYLRIFERR